MVRMSPGVIALNPNPPHRKKKLPFPPGRKGKREVGPEQQMEHGQLRPRSHTSGEGPADSLIPQFCWSVIDRKMDRWIVR